MFWRKPGRRKGGERAEEASAGEDFLPQVLAPPLPCWVDSRLPGPCRRPQANGLWGGGGGGRDPLEGPDRKAPNPWPHSAGVLSHQGQGRARRAGGAVAEEAPPQPVSRQQRAVQVQPHFPRPTRDPCARPATHAASLHPHLCPLGQRVGREAWHAGWLPHPLLVQGGCAWAPRSARPLEASLGKGCGEPRCQVRRGARSGVESEGLTGHPGPPRRSTGWATGFQPPRRDRVRRGPWSQQGSGAGGPAPRPHLQPPSGSRIGAQQGRSLPFGSRVMCLIESPHHPTRLLLLSLHVTGQEAEARRAKSEHPCRQGWLVVQRPWGQNLPGVSKER